MPTEEENLQGAESRSNWLGLYVGGLNQKDIGLGVLGAEEKEGLLRGCLFRSFSQQVSHPHQVVGEHGGAD